MSYESELKGRFADKADESFGDWLASPLVRHTMATIPDPALRELLRSAFDAGNVTGIGCAMIEMLTLIGKRQ